MLDLLETLLKTNLLQQRGEAVLYTYPGIFLSAYSYIFPKQLYNPHFTNASRNKSLSLILLLITQHNDGKENAYSNAIKEMKNTNGTLN